MALPNSVAPSDTILGPIIAGLIVVTQQLQGIGTCYPTPPDGPPEDNSVLFPCKSWSFSDMTNGRLRIRLTFNIMHIFGRRLLDEAFPDIMAWIPAWWAVLGDYNNQTLSGTVRSLDLKQGSIETVQYADDTFLALTHEISVLTEFSINTQPH